MRKIKRVNETGEEVPDNVSAEAAGTMFDPSQQHMDLSKDEKRRTTALLMAIQAYDKLIIKDAEMYIAIRGEERRGDWEGPKIKPATIHAIVDAAVQFDAFIEGKQLAQQPPQDRPTESVGKLEE
jgi:hypothetical protein